MVVRRHPRNQGPAAGRSETRRLALPAAALALLIAAVACRPPTDDAPEAPPVAEIATAARDGSPVLFVGLDGADWQLLDRYLAVGAMPNLARLVAEGVHGELKSENPPLSPLLWTTMLTGASPLEHRILDFTRFHPETGLHEPITSGDRRVPAIWNMASYGGRSVAVFGMWASHPAEAVRGLLISDRLFSFFHAEDAPPPGIVHPQSSEDWARRTLEAAERKIDFAEVARFLPSLTAAEYQSVADSERPYDHPVSALRRILVETRVYHRLAVDHLTGHQPDLTVLYIQGTDTVGHMFAPYAPPRMTGVSERDFQRYRQVPELYYRQVDELLGIYLELAAERGAVLMLASDHGFHWREGRPSAVASNDMETAAQWHRSAGIYLLWGNRVESLAERQSGPLRRVSATLLRLLGLPPGRQVAGPPLPGVDASRWKSVSYRDHYQPAPGAGGPADPEAAAREIAKLEALGYLGGGEASGPAAAGSTRTAGSLNNEGLILQDLGRLEEAEAAFRQALELAPERPATHSNLGILLGGQERFDEAIEHLRATARATPEAPAAYLNLAIAFSRAGRWREAVEQYGRLLELVPDHPEFRYFRAVALIQTGDHRGAAAELEEVLRRQPGNRQARRLADDLERFLSGQPARSPG